MSLAAYSVPAAADPLALWRTVHEQCVLHEDAPDLFAAVPLNGRSYYVLRLASSILSERGRSTLSRTDASR